MATESGDESSSPSSRIKFLCSHGGKILPRPGDGQLKYVGGETRMVAVPRETSFSELMKKLNRLVEGNMVVKYQTSSEDLDALVSVRTDEDLKLMFDEFNCHENEGASRSRTYLFPANPIVLENQIGPADPLALEQRYIDAINGIVRPGTKGKLTPIRAHRLGYSISAGSSPKSGSLDNKTLDPPAAVEQSTTDGYHSNRRTMHRVWSSPSLSSLNNSPLPQAINLSHQQFVQPQCHYHQNYDQTLKPPCHPSPAPRLPQDHRTKRISPASSCMRQDLLGVPMGHGHGLNQLYGIGVPMAGNGGSIRYGWHDDCLVYGNRWIERPSSAPISQHIMD